jgi:hypothetical protein
MTAIFLSNLSVVHRDLLAYYSYLLRVLSLYVLFN